MTAANTRRSDGSRFYTKTGEAVYEIPKKSGKGMKKPNITDAIEMDLVPSVTTIIKTLNKPALTAWLQEQAVLAVLTTPRKPGEPDDEFVHRVLHVEKIQEEQADKAAGLGTDIHAAIEAAVNYKDFDDKFIPFVNPVMMHLKMMGQKVWSEKVLVGEGYAGRADYLGEDANYLTLTDFKTTGTVPEKDAYDEHKMQVAAYAKTLAPHPNKHIRTAVIYISTKDPGIVMVHVQEEWDRNFRAFNHLLQVWRFLNGVAM